jgi:hypothetical protein
MRCHSKLGSIHIFSTIRSAFAPKVTIVRPGRAFRTHVRCFAVHSARHAHLVLRYVLRSRKPNLKAHSLLPLEVQISTSQHIPQKRRVKFKEFGIQCLLPKLNTKNWGGSTAPQASISRAMQVPRLVTGVACRDPPLSRTQFLFLSSTLTR